MQGFEDKDAGMQGFGDKGCKDLGTKDAGMQGCREQGCRDAGMQGCKDTGMQGYRDAGMQGSRMQGCKYRGRPERDFPRLQPCAEEIHVSIRVSLPMTLQGMP